MEELKNGYTVNPAVKKIYAHTPGTCKLCDKRRAELGPEYGIGGSYSRSLIMDNHPVQVPEDSPLAVDPAILRAALDAPGIGEGFPDEPSPKAPNIGAMQNAHLLDQIDPEKVQEVHTGPVIGNCTECSAPLYPGLSWFYQGRSYCPAHMEAVPKEERNRAVENSWGYCPLDRIEEWRALMQDPDKLIDPLAYGETYKGRKEALEADLADRIDYYIGKPQLGVEPDPEPDPEPDLEEPQRPIVRILGKDPDEVPPAAQFHSNPQGIPLEEIPWSSHALKAYRDQEERRKQKEELAYKRRVRNFQASLYDMLGVRVRPSGLTFTLDGVQFSGEGREWSDMLSIILPCNSCGAGVSIPVDSPEDVGRVLAGAVEALCPDHDYGPRTGTIPGWIFDMERGDA